MSLWYPRMRARLSCPSRSKTSCLGVGQPSRPIPLRSSPITRPPGPNLSNKTKSHLSHRKGNNPKPQLRQPPPMWDTLWLPRWRMSWFQTGNNTERSTASSRLNGASLGWKRHKPFRFAIHIGPKGAITTSIQCSGWTGWVDLRFSAGIATLPSWESSTRTGSRGCMCPRCPRSRSSGRQSLNSLTNAAFSWTCSSGRWHVVPTWSNPRSFTSSLGRPRSTYKGSYPSCPDWAPRTFCTGYSSTLASSATSPRRP